MLKRYRAWTEANPLLDWLLTVAVGLTVCLTLFFIIPGPRQPGFAMLLVLSPPTHDLMRRMTGDRRQARPVPPSQEKGVGLIALVASLGSFGALAACVLGGRWGWPLDRVGPMLMMFSVCALLSLGLGQAARHTAAGRWGLRLTAGLFTVMVVVALVAVLRRAVAHA